VEKPAGIERVRDEPELEPALAQRLQQAGVWRRAAARGFHAACSASRNRVELLVVDLDSEIPSNCGQGRVLELLDRAGGPEETARNARESAPPALHLRQVVAPERREPGAMAGLDERIVVARAHQGVAPVEEDRPRARG
jgi:hypothetical protein